MAVDENAGQWSNNEDFTRFLSSVAIMIKVAGLLPEIPDNMREDLRPLLPLMEMIEFIGTDDVQKSINMRLECMDGQFPYPLTIICESVWNTVGEEGK